MSNCIGIACDLKTQLEYKNCKSYMIVFVFQKISGCFFYLKSCQSVEYCIIPLDVSKICNEFLDPSNLPLDTNINVQGATITKI